jgi:hypothetical protein
VVMRIVWKANLALALALGCAGCVSRVSVEGAPCPCPQDGMECCESLGSLGKCIRSGAQCPTKYPSSSAEPCQRDGDCPSDEVCESWTVDGAPAGPRQCRRTCPGSYPCADGEVCETAPHDLQALQDLSVARMCISATPAAGCENQGCHECTDLGSTYCDGNKVRGCFLAIHPQCGLTCRSLTVTDCDQLGCVVKDGAAQCGTAALYMGPCVDMDCAKCGVGLPGSFFCDGNSLAVCVALPTTHVSCNGECNCSQICVPEVVATCVSCTQSADAPSCNLQ